MDELKKRIVEIGHLDSLLGLANWDEEIYMPKHGGNARAVSMSHFSGLIHHKFVSIDHDGLLTKLKKQVDSKKLRGKDAIIVSQIWRKYQRKKKLPEAFVREMTEILSKSQQVWIEARKNNDFKMFLPWLRKVVDLKRKEAEYLGYEKSPYDALIERYEFGMTSEEASKILNDLKDFLMPYLQKIKALKIKVDTKKLQGSFPIEKQQRFNEMVAKTIGFDLERGRIDTTTHPFAIGLHPSDVRITTRYKENDVLYSLGSIIHEAGHGMYEQGLPVEHFGTPLGESSSLGIHESQSRMWENIIGKSLPFWNYFYPKLQKEFPVPFKKIPLKEFHRIINKVSPTLIRTESDEVTYNLHIILRFEIEKEMIEGTIDLKDLPKIWKAKMKEYLGIDVPNDREGVLQDVHWSAGLIGYFPTYSFGNQYSAQFFNAMKKDIPNMDAKISKGNFKEINAWLKKHIHSHGKTYKAGDLAKKATGEELTSAYFIEYLKNKYKGLYGA